MFRLKAQHPPETPIMNICNRGLQTEPRNTSASLDTVLLLSGGADQCQDADDEGADRNHEAMEHIGAFMSEEDHNSASKDLMIDVTRAPTVKTKASTFSMYNAVSRCTGDLEDDPGRNPIPADS
eukprot:749517-Hanusia_phi.AAC.1